MKPSEHPTVVRMQRSHAPTRTPGDPLPLDADWLRGLALEAGADDVGLVDLDRPSLGDQRDDILDQFPRARTLVSFVCRMNRESIRSPARSVANLEFHHTGDEINEVGRRIVATLERNGIGAVNPAMGFPMETDQFPGKIWVVAHKPVAVAAGLGRMGIHRNVIHPRFGNFILLGTVLVAAEATAYDQPIDYSPCLECKLCVAACPVGAISPDGQFDFSACYTHNYREFMGGFTDWVGQIADSRDFADYRKQVTDAESSSMWQSLSFGANYKAAYCMAVCPAGEDVIGPFLADRKDYLARTVKPLQDKAEPVYIVPGSDAEEHLKRRFPHKRPRSVRGGLRPRSIRGFLEGLPLVFQRKRSAGVDATYHFSFTGEERGQATVVIRDQTLRVEDGHHGEADLHVRADSRTWLGFLAKERKLSWALLTRRIRLAGSPRHLLAFGKCFLAER
jgi:ferredoxin